MIFGIPSSFRFLDFSGIVGKTRIKMVDTTFLSILRLWLLLLQWDLLWLSFPWYEKEENS